MKRSPIRRRRRTKHQERNLEHRAYVEWIHTQRCAACGSRQNIHAAHVGRGGTGMKHGTDAETIPLCGPHLCPCGCAKTLSGCHFSHDNRCQHFGADVYSRAELREWDALQIAVHRGRFEARTVSNELPF